MKSLSLICAVATVGAMISTGASATISIFKDPASMVDSKNKPVTSVRLDGGDALSLYNQLVKAGAKVKVNKYNNNGSPLTHQVIETPTDYCIRATYGPKNLTDVVCAYFLNSSFVRIPQSSVIYIPPPGSEYSGGEGSDSGSNAGGM